MNIEINKKLFEAIMDIDDCGRLTIKDTCIYYNYGHRCISFDSYFHLCKRWAFELGYELRSWHKRVEIVEISRKYYVDVHIVKADTEVLAVILATNYLFKELGYEKI